MLIFLGVTWCQFGGQWKRGGGAGCSTSPVWFGGVAGGVKGWDWVAQTNLTWDPDRAVGSACVRNQSESYDGSNTVRTSPLTGLLGQQGCKETQEHKLCKQQTGSNIKSVPHTVPGSQALACFRRTEFRGSTPSCGVPSTRIHENLLHKSFCCGHHPHFSNRILHIDLRWVRHPTYPPPIWAWARCQYQGRPPMCLPRSHVRARPIQVWSYTH